MVETEERLNALVGYAARRNRPLSLREYRYLKAYIRWKRSDRLIHGWFSIGVGFSAMYLGSLALSITPFALVLMFAGAFLNLLAAETLDPKERHRTGNAPVRRPEHPLLREHRVRLAELERIGA